MIPQEPSLSRANTTTRTTNKITPSIYTRSTSLPSSESSQLHLSGKLLLTKNSSTKPHKKLSIFLRSLLNIFTFPTCKWLTMPSQMPFTPPLTRKVTGTLYGHRKGHVNLAMQDDPKSEPIILLELATSTSNLVKEMSSGHVRIALECEKENCRSQLKLVDEPMWSMYCNGKKCGYALNRSCSEFDWHVLRTVQSVSSGAGVIPVVEDGRKVGSEGELMYMRAKFERVVGGRDSEAYYMLNPEGSGGGGPELSIFLMRV